MGMVLVEKEGRPAEPKSGAAGLAVVGPKDSDRGVVAGRPRVDVAAGWPKLDNEEAVEDAAPNVGKAGEVRAGPPNTGSAGNAGSAGPLVLAGVWSKGSAGDPSDADEVGWLPKTKAGELAAPNTNGADDATGAAAGAAVARVVAAVVEGVMTNLMP